MKDNFECENIDSAVSYCYFFGSYCVAYAIKDSAVILHTPSGCQRRILYVWSMHDNSNNFKLTLTTNIIDKDVIFGTEKKLKKLIEDTLYRYDETVLFLITSCSPEIIGMDYNLALPSVEISRNIRIIPINSPGFRGDFYDGYSGTLKDLIVALGNKYSEEKDECKINIMGYFFTRYEDDEYSNICEIKNIIENIGLEVNSIFLSGEEYSKLENYATAKYNVLFPYAQNCEKYLDEIVKQENVICELPIGIEKTIEFITKLGKATGNLQMAQKFIKERLSEVIPKIQTTLHITNGKKVAIISDYQTIPGLLSFILELGMEPVVVASYNKTNEKLNEKINKVMLQNSLLLYKPIVLCNCNRKQFKSCIKNTYIDLCIGSSIEARDLEELNIPVLEISFPLFETHYNYNFPTVGFNGVLNLNTKIFNLLNRERVRRNAVERKLDSIKRDRFFPLDVKINNLFGGIKYE